jgi:Concanavalin A-like lectin/glucanases superfamily
MSITYIDCGDSATSGIKDLNTAGTYLAWFLTTSTAAAQRIYVKGKFIRHQAALNMELSVIRATTNLNVVATHAMFALNKWMFCAMTYDTTLTNTDQYCYFGDLSTTVTEATSYGTRVVGSGAVTSDSGTNARIGTGNLQPFINGRVGLVQIYNRQLSVAELRAIQFDCLRGYNLNGCVLSVIPNLVNIADLSGAKNTLTVTGAPTQGAAPPLRVRNRITKSQGPIYVASGGSDGYYYREYTN